VTNIYILFFAVFSNVAFCLYWFAGSIGRPWKTAGSVIIRVLLGLFSMALVVTSIATIFFVHFSSPDLEWVKSSIDGTGISFGLPRGDSKIENSGKFLVYSSALVDKSSAFAVYSKPVSSGNSPSWLQAERQALLSRIVSSGYRIDLTVSLGLKSDLVLIGTVLVTYRDFPSDQEIVYYLTKLGGYEILMTCTKSRFSPRVNTVRFFESLHMRSVP